MPPSIYDPPPLPEPIPYRRKWPADYYASETPKGVLPPAASYGCGAVALLILLGVFAGGYWLSHGGFAEALDFTFGMTLGEMRGMYAPDVTPTQKQTLEQEIESMRADVRDNKLPPANMRPVLLKIQKSIRDNKLTSAEVDELIATTRRARVKAPARPSLRL